MAKSKRRRNRPAPPPPPPPPPASDVSVLPSYPRLSRIVPPAALILLAAVSYWPVYFAGFVWDDAVFTDSQAVATWSGLWDIWFTRGGVEYEGHYWPVIYTSFWLEHKLWGYSPAGFHAVNVLLHGTVSVLLWRLLARLAVPGAWLAAAVFAAHPIHVEAVAWIISRKNLLATLFYLLAAGFWLRHYERSQTGDYIKMLALFTVGMFSKSFVITLPAAILIWEWWKRGSVTATSFIRVIPMLLIGTVITLYDISLFTARAHIEFEYSFVERVIAAGKALWFYPAKMLWPDPLPVVYSKWDVSPGGLLNWLPLLAVFALVFALWRARRRIGRGPLAAALFFGATISPMLGLAVNSYMLFAFAADRYLYPASIGFIALLVAAAVVACRRLPAPAMRAAQAVAVLLLVCYGALTWNHSRIYHDEITFFTHVSSHNPDAHHAYYNLGVALRDEERTEEALAAFRNAVKQDPNSAKVHLDLGVAWLKTKDFREPEMEDYRRAERAFREAIRLKSKDAKAWKNLAAALRRQKRFKESLETMETAARIDKDVPAWHYFYMGRDAGELKQTAKAERYYRRALEADPEFKSALRELVFLYMNAGRYGEAREAYPELPKFIDRLAYEHFNAGRFEKALEIYRHGIAVSPGDADVRANLGAVLAQLGRYSEAVDALEKALEINPRQETALANIKLVRERLNRPE